MLRSLYIVMFVVLTLPCFSQTRDYALVDSFAATVQYENNDINKLTHTLTSPYTDPFMKTRAIFRWITENIAYDYKFINAGKTNEASFSNCKSEGCIAEIEAWNIKLTDRVLKQKRGVCAGYAKLFKRMCGIAGIRCEVIEGYTKSQPFQVGTMGTLNHDWNMVYLDSAYYLMDVTWASGGCTKDSQTGRLGPFKKEYTEYYWATPFEDLSRDHYPQDAKWVLQPSFTKERFMNTAYIRPDLQPTLHIVYPDTGIINASLGDTIHFKIRSNYYFEDVTINTNLFRNPANPYDPKQQKIPYKRTKELYEFDYVVTSKKLDNIDILFDYEQAIRFRTKITRR